MVGLFALYEVTQVLVVLKRSNVIGVIKFNNNSQAVKDQQMWNHIMDGSQVLKKSIIMTVYQKSDYICSITSTALFLLGVGFKLPLSGSF